MIKPIKMGVWTVIKKDTLLRIVMGTYSQIKSLHHIRFAIKSP